MTVYTSMRHPLCPFQLEHLVLISRKDTVIILSSSDEDDDVVSFCPKKESNIITVPLDTATDSVSLNKTLPVLEMCADHRDSQEGQGSPATDLTSNESVNNPLLPTFPPPMQPAFDFSTLPPIQPLPQNLQLTAETCRLLERGVLSFSFVDILNLQRNLLN